MSEQNVITEKVDPTAYNAPSVMLINAMAALAGDKGDIAEIFKLEYTKGEKPMVDVQLFVNGVSVPFAAAVTFAWESLNAKINKKVEERALALVNGSGLIDLKNALDNAEWQIEEALKKALKDNN
jgi:hypothetical protein